MAAAGLPTLTMLALGLWGVGRNSTYSAEAVTYWAANLPLPQLFHLLSHDDIFHGLYYLLIHVVFEFGRSQTSMRLLSVFAAAVSVYLTYRLTLRFTERRWVGFLAASMVAVSPGMSEYAQDGRSYALDVMVALAVTLALLRALEKSKARVGGPARTALLWLPYVGLLTLCGYLQELSMVLLAIGQGVALLTMRCGWRSFRNWFLAAVAAGVLVAPLILLSLIQAGAGPHKPPVTWYDMMTLVRMYFGYPTAVIVLMLALTVLGSVPLRADRDERNVQRFLVPLLVVPFVVLVTESVTTRPLFVQRYLLFGLPAVMILAAVGASRLGLLVPRTLRGTTVVAAGLAVLVVMVGLQWSTQQWLRTPDSRTWNLMSEARYLAAHARPGDGVDYLPRSLLYIGLAYPWAVQGLVDYHTARSPAAAGTLHGVRTTSLEAHHELLGLKRVWLVYDPGKVPPGHHFGALTRRFHLVSTHRVHNGRIDLYRRNSRVRPGCHRPGCLRGRRRTPHKVLAVSHSGRRERSPTTHPNQGGSAWG